jgi:hypothetical protein
LGLGAVISLAAHTKIRLFKWKPTVRDMAGPFFYNQTDRVFFQSLGEKNKKQKFVTRNPGERRRWGWRRARCGGAAVNSSVKRNQQQESDESDLVCALGK